MSDIFGSGEWGKAAAKLIDVIDRNIGAWTYKSLVVRNAKADVEARKVLAQGELDIRELRTRRALPPKSATGIEDDGAIDVEFDEPLALPERTEQRVTYQEQKRQLNVENVVHDAFQELKASPAESVSDEKVDDDWAARYFSNVQDVSTEHMQKIWAKVLAGETVRPGSFSLRTLETLRNLSSVEANLFARVAPFIERTGALIRTRYADEHVRYEEFLTLQDAGLFDISSDDAIAILNQSPESEKFLGAINFADVMVIGQADRPRDSVNLSVYRATISARELVPVVAAASNREYVRSVRDLLMDHGCRATIHRIVATVDGLHKFDKTVLE